MRRAILALLLVSGLPGLAQAMPLPKALTDSASRVIQAHERQERSALAAKRQLGQRTATALEQDLARLSKDHRVASLFLRGDRLSLGGGKLLISARGFETASGVRLDVHEAAQIALVNEWQRKDIRAAYEREIGLHENRHGAVEKVGEIVRADRVLRALEIKNVQIDLPGGFRITHRGLLDEKGSADWLGRHNSANLARLAKVPEGQFKQLTAATLEQQLAKILDAD